jgi:hypothetical protein
VLVGGGLLIMKINFACWLYLSFLIYFSVLNDSWLILINKKPIFLKELAKIPNNLHIHLNVSKSNCQMKHAMQLFKTAHVSAKFKIKSLRKVCSSCIEHQDAQIYQTMRRQF